MGVPRVLQGSFKGVSWKFQGSFKVVSMGVSRKFQGYFKKVSRVFQGRLKGFSGRTGHLKEVLREVSNVHKALMFK